MSTRKLSSAEVAALLAVDDPASKPEASAAADSAGNSDTGDTGPNSGSEDLADDRDEPSRESVERLLATLFHQYASVLSTEFARLLKTPVQVSLRTISANLAVLDSPADHETACSTCVLARHFSDATVVSLTNGLAHVAVHRLLGGSDETILMQQRSLTELERDVVLRAFECAAEVLEQTWSFADEIDLSVDQVDCAARCESRPEDPAAATARFDLAIGNQAGSLWIYVPGQIVNWIAVQDREREAKRQQRLADSRCHVELAAAADELTTADVPQVGSILMTRQVADEPLHIELPDGSVVQTTLGAHQGRKALRIQGRLES